MAESAHPPARLEKTRQKLFELEARIEEMQGLAASIFIFSGYPQIEQDDPLSDSIHYLSTNMMRRVRDLDEWHTEALQILRGSAAASVQTDPHPRWFQEWLVLEDIVAKAHGDLKGSDPVPGRVEALGDTCDRLRMDIASTPAKTPAGAAVQLRLMHNIYFEHHSTHDEIFRKCLDSVIAFLESGLDA